MKQGLKITISLFITSVIMALFIIFAFSGFFNWIEAQFYDPRLQDQYQKQVELIAREITEKFHKRYLNRFNAVVKNDYMASAFLQDQSKLAAEIQKRNADFESFKASFQNFQFVRFIDVNGKIHLSTLNTDLRQKSGNKIIYYDYGNLNESLSIADLLVAKEQPPRMIIDAAGERFVYAFPITDQFDIYKGTALFYVGMQDLANFLIALSNFSISSEIALLGKTGTIINYPQSEIEDIADTVRSHWLAGSSELSDVFGISVSDVNGKRTFEMFTAQTADFGLVGLIIDQQEFAIKYSIKIILLILAGVSLFLFIYFCLNLKQDPLVIITHRIKQLEIRVLKEFIESEEAVNWEKWYKELVLKSSRIKAKIKDGVRFNKKYSTEIEDLINKSWDEILSIIASRAESATAQPRSADLARIEELITRALSSNRIVISANQIVQQPGITTSLPSIGQQVSGIPEAGTAADTDEVEDLDVEEVGEALEEVGEALEEAGEALEEAGEALEEAGEALEEVEEATLTEEGDKEELLAEEFREGGVREEIEEIEEIEEVEEVEAVPEEAEDLESLEEIPEAEMTAEQIASTGQEQRLRQFSSENRKKVNQLRLNDQDKEKLRSLLAKVDQDIRQADKSQPVEQLAAFQEADAALENIFSPGAGEDTVEIPAPEVTDVEAPMPIFSDEDTLFIEEIDVEQIDVEQIEEIEEIEELRPVTVPDTKQAGEGSAEGEVEELLPVEEIIPLPPLVFEVLDELEVLQDIEELPLAQEFVPLPPLQTEQLEELIRINEDQEEEREMDEFESTCEEQTKIVESAEPEELSEPEELNEPEEEEVEEMEALDEEIPEPLVEIIVYTFDEMKNKISNFRDSVILEDGVYRIKAELFQKESEPKVKQAPGLETNQDSFINRFRKIKSEKKIYFSDQGLEFDNFLVDDEELDSVISRIKSLVEFSRKINAVSVAILVNDQKGNYNLDISIGLIEKSKELFHFEKKHKFITEFFQTKKVVIINQPAIEIGELKEKFAAEDLKYIKSSVFIPAVYNNTAAVFYIAFPSLQSLSLNEIIDQLNIFIKTENSEALAL